MKAQRAHTAIPPIRLAVYLFCAVMVVVMIAITVYRRVTDTETENLVIMIGNILIWLVPPVCRLLFRDAVSDGVYLFFVIYVFFASFLGTIMTFYENISWYDQLIHSLFGYVGCIVGLFAACKLCDIRKLNPAFAIVFIFSFSMMLAALWEIMEYLGDQWLGNNAQGNPHWVDGILMRNVKDTMEDIICHACGSLVFAAHYIVHTLSGKSLLIGTLKKDFSPKKYLASAVQENAAAVQEDAAAVQEDAAAVQDKAAEIAADDGKAQSLTQNPDGGRMQDSQTLADEKTQSPSQTETGEKGQEN